MLWEASNTTYMLSCVSYVILCDTQPYVITLNLPFHTANFSFQWPILVTAYSELRGQVWSKLYIQHKLTLLQHVTYLQSCSNLKFSYIFLAFILGFQCTKCGKSFGHKQILQLHLQIHALSDASTKGLPNYNNVIQNEATSSEKPSEELTSQNLQLFSSNVKIQNTQHSRWFKQVKHIIFF